MMMTLDAKYSNVIPFPFTRREEAPAELIIDDYDQWSNPNIAAAPIAYCCRFSNPVRDDAA